MSPNELDVERLKQAMSDHEDEQPTVGDEPHGCDFGCAADIARLYAMTRAKGLRGRGLALTDTGHGQEEIERLTGWVAPDPSVPGLPSSFPVGSVSGSPHGAHAYNVEPLEEEAP